MFPGYLKAPVLTRGCGMLFFLNNTGPRDLFKMTCVRTATDSHNYSVAEMQQKKSKWKIHQMNGGLTGFIPSHFFNPSVTFMTETSTEASTLMAR